MKERRGGERQTKTEWGEREREGERRIVSLRRDESPVGVSPIDTTDAKDREGRKKHA